MSSRSHGLVWVKHNSDGRSNGSWWKVSQEFGSNSSGVSVSRDDLSPTDSESGVVDSVLCFEDVCNSLSLIESSSGLILAVLDGKESLMRSLSGLSSSETSECCFLVQSNRLGLVVTFFLLGLLDFFCHSSLIVIMIIY